MNNFSELFHLPSRQAVKFSVLTEDEAEEGVEWIAHIQLSEPEVDDSFDSDYREEVVVTAKTFDTAYKYVQQYIRTMQLKANNKEAWKSAEIISIDQL